MKKILSKEIGGNSADTAFGMFVKVCELIAETLYLLIWVQRACISGSLFGFVCSTGWVDFVALSGIMVLLMMSIIHQHSHEGLLSKKRAGFTFAENLFS